jgi:putative SOS response-associated peptidase YedK
LAGKIHDRMPVILDSADYDAWLCPDSDDVGYLLTKFPPERMTATRVGTQINDPRQEGAECLAAVSAAFFQVFCERPDGICSPLLK